MNLMTFVLGLLLFVPVPQKDEGTRILENVLKKFDGIRDYSVDVMVHLDIPEVKAPDMEATIYFKDPDKFKIDSKGLFFLPKEVGVFNPRMFNPADFNISVLDSLSIDSLPAVRISLSPKKDQMGDRKIILTIDVRNWLIREVASAPYPGREASARITYGEFGGFQLPTRVDVKLDVQSNPQEGGFGGNGGRRGRLKGTAVVNYSNYRINTGLSDGLFKTEE